MFLTGLSGGQKMATSSGEAGGYECKIFVSTPLDRYFCVICQHPSRDPRMSVCCGHVFCKSCIGKVKGPCPTCRDEKFTTFPNKQLDREIKNLDIFCTNVERGCTWQGKLGKIGEHLGICQFEEAKCTKDCEKMIQRRHLTAHIETECPRRQVTCQYCRDTGEHRHIETNHKLKCPKFPVPCPNKCKVKVVPREIMQKHRGECQLELVSCSNNCGEKLERRYLTSHVETRCSRRKVNCQYCHDPVEYQYIENQHKEKCPKLPLPCPNKCKVGTLPREDMEKHRAECPLEIACCSNNCGEKLMRRYLPTHVEKRCACRKVTCQYRHNPVEYRYIENQHKDECPKLPLPCPNKCKVGTVLREDMERHRKECTLEMIQCEYGCDIRMLCTKKLVHDRRNHKKHLMLTKEKLDSTEDKLDNALKQIDALKLLIHQNKLITLAALFESGDQVCPVIIKTSEYNKKVEEGDDNDDVRHPTSFYTHNRGYRMCLAVLPAGYDVGRGTHLSMYLHVMRGRHDDELEWPLKGTFDIKLLNQLGDSEHLSVTITFDDNTKRHGGRVIVGDVADSGWGQRYQLISNEDLRKTTPTCQFLKDDCIYFELNFHK